ncbi:UDP-glycosyltransferase 74G1 [Psilocybe cubensis]|uniref:UDP-glycosyltransferase 74G1 n=2 Tax=Psilocybe cubensis TaxID=181762 RepID=A0ACB8GL91_PSICU|nr:UDP-glycosyltransferase 74G1 [Psilocybe cubensis]KAH9476235.1 UDP-glycosyltransferase 74G1 [Psilocybe cubensis]
MAISNITEATHIVFTAFAAWGHVRPFCILAARLVQANENVVVTMILVPPFLKKAHAEISAEFRDTASESARSRLRVLAPFKSDTENPFDLMPLITENYGRVYQAVVDGKPVSCATTGKSFEAVPPPKLSVIDFFAHPLMLVTRSITGPSVPIVAWISGHMGTLIRFWGPERFGGGGDIAKKVQEEVARTGAPVHEVEERLYSFAKISIGKVVSIPGVPDMYDWEFFPQALAFDLPFAEVIKWGQAGMKEADSIFLTSTYSLEPITLDAARSWYKEWNKEVYVIGPLLPTGYGTMRQSDRGSSEVSEFLDKALVEHGEKSVTLISFGTVFWPKEQDYIEEVLEAFIEKKAPFIICYASMFASMSDNILQKIKDSDLGLISRWIPQQYILSHKATGWFITHGGQNSVMESLGCGIPLICWPFEADQPASAAVLSKNLQVAIELIEVRTGEKGFKPLLRLGHGPKGTREAVGEEIREVIDSCRGEKGALLRENALKVKEAFAKTWEEGGDAINEFRKFASAYNLQLL